MTTVRRGLLAAAVVAPVAAGAATLVGPAAFGLSGTWPWAQLVAFRGMVGAAVGGLGLLGFATATVLRRRAPAAALTAVAVGLTCLGVPVAQAAVLAHRGLRDDPLPAPSTDPRTLTVVEANTLGGAADADALADLLATVGADLVTLPETDAAAAQRYRAAAAARGLTSTAFTSAPRERVSETSLLLVGRGGAGPLDGLSYRQVDSPDGGPGSVVLAPGSGTGPRLAAVHPFPPLTPADTATWRVRARQAVAVCRDGGDAVVAGDLNATVDHPALADLGSCFDAAAARGAGGIGTWTQRVPRALGAPIDHVLATSATWSVTSVTVAPLPGSDHRALVVRLRHR